MKYFLVISICLASFIKNGLTQCIATKSFLSSVTENWSNSFHKCDAVFIDERMILTTATCLTCVMPKCRFMVTSVLNNFHNVTGVYDVEKVYIHPKYNSSTKGYNVGLARIYQKAVNAVIYKLPGYTTGEIEGTSYVWKKDKVLKDAELFSKKAKTTDAKNCKLEEDEICVETIEPVAFGAFDEGSPFVNKENGSFFLRGIYAESAEVADTTYHSFISILNYSKWISNELHKFLIKSDER